MRSLSGLCLSLAGVIAVCGCVHRGSAAPKGASATDGVVGVPAARGAPRGELPWAELSAATFARAKAERKLIVLDGSAEWCHWCHVMEAETYHDPRVRALIERRFIAVKVDVDAHPDLQERYGEWGWPATVVFSPDGEELGKYRGFVEPDRFLELLTAAAERAAPPGGALAALPAAPPPSAAPLSRELVAWMSQAVAAELEDYWDREQGGWGRRQKAPIGGNNAWLLRLAERGDAEARRRVLWTLDQQAQLLDPVWGGIYQYSDGDTWRAPHYEKLMTYQAPALENYAAAYRLTGEPRQLARARAMWSYLARFLEGPDGTFGATQDADLGAHQVGATFRAGRDYYALGERDRLALGVPRVDRHAYGKENGLAIAALVAYHQATGDASALSAAQRAAARILETHLDPRGGITHDARERAQAAPPPLYLADNAAFGLALVRLYQVTGEREHLQAARRLAELLLGDELRDPVSGGMFASTRDPAAVGVLAERRVPQEDNVRALRFLLALSAHDAALARTAAPRLAELTRAVARPAAFKPSGRFQGELLLALDEVLAQLAPD